MVCVGPADEAMQACENIGTVKEGHIFAHTLYTRANCEGFARFASAHACYCARLTTRSVRFAHTTRASASRCSTNPKAMLHASPRSAN